MWILLTILASILIVLTCAYIFHSSENRRKEPCTLPIFVWLIYGILIFIPVVNLVESALWVIYLTDSFYDGSIRISEKNWLGKRY